MQNIPRPPAGDSGARQQPAKKGLSKGCVVGIVAAIAAVVIALVVVAAAAGSLYWFSR